MKMLKLDESYVDEKITRDHPCVKGKFPRAGGGGNNNRTFAFWGRILGPATVFFGFLEGFWTIF